MSQAVLAQHMQVLGVRPGDTATAVRTAWRMAVKKYHPDVAGKDAHDKMAKVNAAYEALKSGVPSDLSASDQDQIRTESRSAQARHTLSDGVFIVDNKDLEVLRRNAFDRLISSGARPTNVGVVGRLLGRKGRFPLHLPKRFVVSGGSILVVLDTPRMHQGTNYIAVPMLVLRDGEIIASDMFTVVPVYMEHKSVKLLMAEGDGLNDALLPNYSGFKTFISNS